MKDDLREQSNIRNFVIISHVDHGKSTLADRMLETTGTIEKRKMREQVLDSMELERERGITIKMAPVSMSYKLRTINYQLNLIDTPGHIDFAYEVSRALFAVEGAILLVDASQGVQAQTLTVLHLAQEAGLKIIPAVNKIDLPSARVSDAKKEIAGLLEIDENEILSVSGKTGEGVGNLLEKIIKSIPAPKFPRNSASIQQNSALVFDFEYSGHQGVIAYVRIFDGEFRKGQTLRLLQTKEKFSCQEVGIFLPERKSKEALSAGEIGYIVTGIKKTEAVLVGDTISSDQSPSGALPGYKKPQPMIWSSVYPADEENFDELKRALSRLQLSDASFSYEEESSGVLGRGFRMGFLGMLHLEIVIERLKRELGIEVITATPTVSYKIRYKNSKESEVYVPSEFPETHEVSEVEERWLKFDVISPDEYVGQVLKLVQKHEGAVLSAERLGARTVFKGEMPLRELMRDFSDELKSATSGYASLSYELADWRPARVTRLDVLVHGELVPAFSRVVSKNYAEREARAVVEKLYKILPRELFAVKIQAELGGRIVASRTLSALKKDVTGYLYGGDRTRKMKLWSKQKKGKKRLKERGNVNIPHDVFVKMIKRG